YSRAPSWPCGTGPCWRRSPAAKPGRGSRCGAASSAPAPQDGRPQGRAPHRGRRAGTSLGATIIPYMPQTLPRSLPGSIDETQALLASGEYVADRSLATSLFLALAMKRPLFLEGEAGVGKTEIAKVVAEALGRDLVRLQCYEGLDIAQAAYEWNYPRQMIEIRMAEAEGIKSREGLEQDIFSERFLVRRPLLRALQSAGAP